MVIMYNLKPKRKLKINFDSKSKPMRKKQTQMERKCYTENSVDMFQVLHQSNVRKQVPMQLRWIIEMSIRCLCDSNCANPYHSIQLGRTAQIEKSHKVFR